ncbi:MAG: LD-carboxypeptidase [Thermoanaerobaculales bacterium]
MGCNWIPLEPGEPLGVVALSGPVDSARLQEGLKTLREWGHPVEVAPNLGVGGGYLAGSDSERIGGLVEILNRGARWIFAARGGYGATRLLPGLPWKRLVDDAIRLVGFSDLTALLNPLWCAGGAGQVHGPMVAAGLDGRFNARRLLAVLRGELVDDVLFRFPEGSILRHGRASGPALGGNLTLLTSLLDTPWTPSYDGSVLFVEEVGEPIYRLDRMLTHLRCSGRLRGVKALIGGSLHGCRPAFERSAAWRGLLMEAAPEGVPVVMGLPFGHGATNMAFPIGAPVEVDTRARRVTWRS